MRDVLRAWFKRTFDSMSVPSYRILWWGTLAAFLSFNMSFTVQSVVAFDLEGTNSAVGLVQLGNGLAWFIVGPFGGVFADRASKRRLLFIAQGGIGIAFLVAGVLILTDQITIMFLVLVTFAQGMAFAFTGPARRAYVADVLPTEKLGNGIALMQLALTTPGVVGPALGGVLIGIGAVGPGGVYLMMAGMLFLVLTSLRLLPPADQNKPKGSVRKDFAEGVRHVWQRPRLRLLIFTFLSLSVVGFSPQVLFPGLLENELGREAKDIGLFLTSTAIAGIIIGLAVAGLIGSRRADGLMYGLGAMYAGSLLLLAVAPSFELAIGVMFLIGLSLGGYQILNNALIVTSADPAYHGRVVALTMLAFGAQGIMGLPFGALGDAIGERWTLALIGSMAGTIILLARLISLRVPATRATPPNAPDGTPAEAPPDDAPHEVPTDAPAEHTPTSN